MGCGERLLASLTLLAAARAHLAEESAVSLADGTSKRLKEVRLGDVLRSYDEASRTATPSTVVRIFESWLPLEQLTEVALPRGRSLWTSVAHPLWSSKDGRVVSLSPHLTWEEYGLEAGMLSAGESLEDEQLHPVSVGALHPQGREEVEAGSRRLGAPWAIDEGNRSSPGPDLRKLRRVLTLGLRPHHWFYAEGVRVHNKGCFLAEASVTLADGSQRPLGEVSLGEAVASWDEVSQRPAVAWVRARPVFQRRQEELVQIELGGGGRLLATEDHPLWSRGGQRLVSLQPNNTREAYGLSVELLQLGDELEGRDLEPLPVIGLRRPSLLASSAAVQGLGTELTEGVESRRLRGAASLGGLAAGWVEVQTLCLEPHHWFYVEGVRVHNKGCFAPWTPIAMADGQQKPLEAVRVNDQVLSWDETARETSIAKVSSVEEFPVGDLLEISMSQRAVFRRLSPGLPNAAEEPGLVVTRDHPIYSARAQGLVSMEPLTTFQHYGLRVSQMQRQELLHQHEGLPLEAVVGNWSGAVNFSRVMTLRLEGHHWFFAQGVLVHNKGGGVGGGGGGSRGGGGGSTVHTRTSMGSRSYATWIVLSGGSRRRYGTYRNEEEGACTMLSEGSVSQLCNEIVVNQCPTRNHSCCYNCLACEQEACIGAIGGCEEFLGQSFESCEEASNEATVFAVLAVLASVGVVCFGCCWCYSHFSANKTVANMEKQRVEMRADQGALPSFLSFSGTYSENGETKTTTYQLNFNHGLISGMGQDDDGQAKVEGRVCLPVGAIQGRICWRETRPGVNIEFDGSINQTAPGSWSINGIYHSSYQSTTGRLSLASAVQGVQVPMPGVDAGNCAPAVCPIVVGQTVVPGEVR